MKMLSFAYDNEYNILNVYGVFAKKTYNNLWYLVHFDLVGFSNTYYMFVKFTIGICFYFFISIPYALN